MAMMAKTVSIVISINLQRPIKDEPVKVQDTELNDDSTNNDNVLRTARNLFIYHIISDIKKRLNYDDAK